MREALVRILEEKLDPNHLAQLKTESKVAKKPVVQSDDESDVDFGKQQIQNMVKRETRSLGKESEPVVFSDMADQFTVTDISNQLGMPHEEKTVSRIIQELRRVHSKKILQTNVRNGKVFQYYYTIKKKQIKTTPDSSLRGLIELNENAYNQILERLGS